MQSRRPFLFAASKGFQRSAQASTVSTNRADIFSGAALAVDTIGNTAQDVLDTPSPHISVELIQRRFSRHLAMEADSEPHPRDYYVKQHRDLLETAVGSHLMSDVPLGMFLSGGLDSSAVAALATKIRGDRIQTFSVGYAEEEFSELRYARAVADHIRSEHHEVRLRRDEFFGSLPHLIWHEDEPIVWPSSVSLYFVARLAREQVTVVLTGEGSDETLAGYTRYAWTLINSRMDDVYRALTTDGLRRMVRKALYAGPLGASLYRKLEHTFLVRDGRSLPSFYYDNFLSAFSADEQCEMLTPDALRVTGDAYASSMEPWEKSRGDLLHRLLYTDINSYLIELLMKQDQMSMAASVESRVPFLDHELVEFAVKIAAKFSVAGLAGKLILKHAIENLLPKSIIYRQKKGFPTPWDYWLAPATACFGTDAALARNSNGVWYYLAYSRPVSPRRRASSQAWSGSRPVTSLYQAG